MLKAKGFGRDTKNKLPSVQFPLPSHTNLSPEATAVEVLVSPSSLLPYTLIHSFTHSKLCLPTDLPIQPSLHQIYYTNYSILLLTNSVSYKSFLLTVH